MNEGNCSHYPQGFPVAQYESVQKRIAPYQPGNPDLYRHFAGGWNAVQNRALGCERCAQEYTTLLVKYGVSPTPYVRAIQDITLYGFFVYGLSAIESWFFAMHAAAALGLPRAFPMATPRELRDVDPARVLCRYRKAYPDSPTATAMRKFLRERAYREWVYVRNVLAHRSAPGRHFYQPPRAGAPNADWISIEIVLDKDTLLGRFPWLMTTLHALIQASEDFTAQNL